MLLDCCHFRVIIFKPKNIQNIAFVLWDDVLEVEKSDEKLRWKRNNHTNKRESLRNDFHMPIE